MDTPRRAAVLRWFDRRARPDFLGVGTQKGGTSSLYHLLKAHPGIYLPAEKEIHYFTTHYARGPRWYAHHFQAAQRGQRRGEITPFYLFHHDVPRRIHAFDRRIRLIVLLRDPVERALSHYFHARRHGFEALGLEDALAAEQQRLASGDPFHLQKHSYLSRSDYPPQLSRYEELFPAKQLLILRSEDLFTDPESIWYKLQQFLQLQHLPLTDPLPWVNAGEGEARHVSPQLRDRLRNQLGPSVTDIQRRYGISWDW